MRRAFGNSPRRPRRGFTLVEAIAAIVLLALAAPPMLWALREGQLRAVDPVLASRARWLAESKLEDLIADRHSETRGWDYLVKPNYPKEDPVTGFDGFARQVTFVETGPDLVSPGTGYLTATVEVEWTSPTRGTRTLSVSTVLTEPGS